MGGRASDGESGGYGEQGTLFGTEVAGGPGEWAISGRGSGRGAGIGEASGDGRAAKEAGYRGPIAAKAAGITYRQLDYWARTGLVEPSVRSASGSGTARLYSFRDILVLKVVKRLLDTGVSLHNIRAAIGHLRSRGVADLARITLLSDGATVYECTSPDEVVDLLAGGQGVFGIAVGRVVSELEGSLASLPREQVADSDSETGSTTHPSGLTSGPETGTGVAPLGADELASRRRRRSSA